MKNSFKVIISVLVFIFSTKCYSQTIVLGNDENAVYNTLYDRVRSHNNSQNSNSLQTFNVKHIDGIVSEIIISVKDGFLYDLGVNSDFSIHYIMENGYLNQISTHYENISVKRLKDTFDKQYAEKNIASYYFSDDYKTYKIVVLDNSGLATVEEKKTSSGNFPQTVRSSLVKIGVLANDNNVNDNINVLNKPAEASLNSKTLSNSYCNEHAVYTVKLNGSNVTIYYTNLNHLDRNYTYKGYIERNKIYIKAPNKSAKYAWEFTLVENHKLSMFDNNKKQWVTLEFCDAPVNANALYKGKLNNTNYPEPTGNASPGNQGTPDSSTITESNPKVIVGLIQRSFINQPTVSNVEHLEGRVVVKLTVNRNGDVTSAHAGEKGTTIIDSVILKKCEDAVKQVKITSSSEAPLSQNGVVLFVFKTN